MSIEAMKLALDALEMVDQEDNDRDFLNPAQCYQLDKAITSLRQAIEKEEQAQKQEPVGFDKTVLDEWTKEYKVEVAYWKAKHDELLRILKQNAEPWVQEPVGVVTGCAEHGEFFTAVFRSKTEVLVDTKIYTSPPQRQPLTDEEITALLVELCVPKGYEGVTETFTAVVRAIEAAHGIKENTCDH